MLTSSYLLYGHYYSCYRMFEYNVEIFVQRKTEDEEKPSLGNKQGMAAAFKPQGINLLQFGIRNDSK